MMGNPCLGRGNSGFPGSDVTPAQAGAVPAKAGIEKGLFDTD
jgi:hypothetical protein